MKQFWIRQRAGLLLFALGIMAMGIGVFRREIDVVWMKAAAICLECIGIG